MRSPATATATESSASVSMGRVGGRKPQSWSHRCHYRAAGSGSHTLLSKGRPNAAARTAALLQQRRRLAVFAAPASADLYPPASHSTNHTDEDEGGARGKQSRSEKKSRKAMQKLGMKALPGVSRVTIRKSKNVSAVAQRRAVLSVRGCAVVQRVGGAQQQDGTAGCSGCRNRPYRAQQAVSGVAHSVGPSSPHQPPFPLRPPHHHRRSCLSSRPPTCSSPPPATPTSSLGRPRSRTSPPRCEGRGGGVGVGGGGSVCACCQNGWWRLGRVKAGRGSESGSLCSNTHAPAGALQSRR